MIKNYRKIFLYMPSFIFASTLFPAQKAFIRIVPKLTFALPLAMIGALHNSNYLHSQPPSKPDLSAMHTVELNTFDLAILKELIRVKSHALAAEIKNKKPSDHNDESSENGLFIIKHPTPLTESEAQKDIMQRISEHYVGELPDKIKDIIAHFQRKRNTPGKALSNAILLYGDKVTLRLDYDPIKGPHINATDYRDGKTLSLALPFEGNEETVKSLLKHLQ